MSTEAPLMDTTPEVTQPTAETQPEPPVDDWADIPEEVMGLSTDEILSRTRLIDNDVKVCPGTIYCS